MMSLRLTTVALWTGLFATVAATSLPAFAEPQTAPPWAYPVIDPAVKLFADDGPKTLPGSTASFIWPQLYNTMFAADWYPGDHPAMPAMVAHGAAPDVFACGMCHQPNGRGRPENASLAGLPAPYILQQLADMKAGSRHSSEPGTSPQVRMVSSATHIPDSDAQEAAAYFASLPAPPPPRVVETATVPRTTLIFGSVRVPVPDGGTEPIGQRVIEVPEDVERVKLHDPHAGFVAYVPLGSIAKGSAIVTTGGDKTIACATCHGANLLGQKVGDVVVPPIAGRSAIYIVRQLYDFRHGARAGAQSALMQPVVAGLDLDDMIAIAAYVASLPSQVAQK